MMHFIELDDAKQRVLQILLKAAEEKNVGIERIYTMVNIRYIREEDKVFWFKLDKHLSETEFEKKIRDKMGWNAYDIYTSR